MSFIDQIKKFWKFLQEDTWQSWIVSLILIFIGFKFIFFPFLTLVTGSQLPLVVIESCSMYHETNFDNWWDQNGQWYESKEITKTDFKSFNFHNGLNKGDIIFVWNRGDLNLGDVIIFEANQRYPIIHRLVSLQPLATKGDHNPRTYFELGEDNIPRNHVIGQAKFRIPYAGWLKLIFFEFSRPTSERGLC